VDYNDRLSSISESIEALGVELGDVQFTMLREAVRTGDTKLSSIEKGLARARRSLDKARLLVGTAEGALERHEGESDDALQRDGDDRDRI
jgi:hypothetical protein